MRTSHLAIAVSFALLAGGASAQQPTASVRQGDVAHWSGATASECGFLGMRYPAVAGTCFYPIDMEAKPGVHEIALYREDGTGETLQLTVMERQCAEMDVEVPERFVDISEEDRARHAEERARLLEALAMRSGEPEFELPLAPPTEPMPRGDDDFCARRSFNEGEIGSQHIGRDYEIAAGTNLAAPADGTVRVAEEMFMTGGTVIIDHGAGLMSEFFHLGELAVEEGDTVERGATIGQVGNSGRSSGPHLHLGARWLEQRIDPAQLLAEPEDLVDVTNADAPNLAATDGGGSQDDADLADADLEGRPATDAGAEALREDGEDGGDDEGSN